MSRSYWRPADLVKWRLDRAWTQERCARWYGCSTRAWQRYEAGDRDIPKPLVQRLNNSHRARSR